MVFAFGEEKQVCFASGEEKRVCFDFGEEHSLGDLSSCLLLVVELNLQLYLLDLGDLKLSVTLGPASSKAECLRVALD